MREPRNRAGQLSRWAATVGIGVFASGPVLAQLPSNDPIARAKAMRAVADQKADADIREVIRDAEQAATASPTVAVQRLKRALVSLDLSAAISSEKRQELAIRLQQKIAAIEKPAVRPALDPKGAEQKAASRKAFEAYVQ